MPLTTGTVTVISNGGSAALAYDPTGEARWRGVQAGYHEVYELAITAGDDRVEGVRVDGPDVHFFTAPLPGASVDATEVVAVTWSSGESADAATLETEQLDSVAIADTGNYAIAIGGLKSKPDETEQERLRLDRSMRVAPAGAVAGIGDARARPQPDRPRRRSDRPVGARLRVTAVMVLYASCTATS